jgi:peptidoglycan/xylan/chitin deacetylase (PgdA/CDA1 family)
MKKNLTQLSASLFVIVFALTGCVGLGGKLMKKGKSEPDAFLLYDQYADYLGRKDIKLKDSFIFCASSPEKIVALTFDDGPTANSEKILSILERLQCPAAFFLVAENMNPENMEQYRNPLFETYIHGYAHENYTAYDKEKCFTEVEKARNVFESLGIVSEYFRPPYGAFNEDLKDALAENKLTGILWSLDSLDWSGLAGNDLAGRVVSNVRDGDIVLFHETPWTADELEKIVTGIRGKGFRIVPLKYLLQYPKCPSPPDKHNFSPEIELWDFSRTY